MVRVNPCYVTVYMPLKLALYNDCGIMVLLFRQRWQPLKAVVRVDDKRQMSLHGSNTASALPIFTRTGAIRERTDAIVEVHYV